MSAVLYPVAANAEAALASPQGRAVREREAQSVAGEPVHFVREFTGPVFKTEDSALDAYAGRVDDERPGTRRMIPAQAGLRTAWQEAASKPLVMLLS